MWIKITSIEVNGLDALRTDRQNEKFTTETCKSLRKEMVQVQTQLKDGIDRAIYAETSIGAQDAELVRVIADLEALRKKYRERQSMKTRPGYQPEHRK